MGVILARATSHDKGFRGLRGGSCAYFVILSFLILYGRLEINVKMPVTKGENGRETFNLKELIQRLHEVFAGDFVDVDLVQDTMRRYDASSKDWEPFCVYDKHRYTRNLVDAGNAKFNLMLLCWGGGQRSAIHDHSESHCWMKVVRGELTECLYGWPTEDKLQSLDTGQPMSPVRETILPLYGDTYIHDKIGLHRVGNHGQDFAVSMHLYSPPFDVCRSFNEKTGKSKYCQMVFWSEYGVRCKFAKPPLTTAEIMKD